MLRFLPENPTANYGRLDEDKFVEHLVAIKRDLIRFKTETFHDFLMVYNGPRKGAIFQGKYRFTRDAFDRFFGAMVESGTYLFYELAGTGKRKARFPKEAYSLDLAIQTYNSLLALRYPYVGGSALFRNTCFVLGDKIIDVTTPTFARHFNPPEVYRIFKDACKGFTFHWAGVNGLTIHMYLVDDRKKYNFRDFSYSPAYWFRYNLPGRSIKVSPAWYDRIRDVCLHASFLVTQKQKYIRNAELTSLARLEEKIREATVFHFDDSLLQTVIDKASANSYSTAQEIRDLFFKTIFFAQKRARKFTKLKRRKDYRRFDRFGILSGPVTDVNAVNYLLTLSKTTDCYDSRAFYRELAGRLLFLGKLKLTR